VIERTRGSAGWRGEVWTGVRNQSVVTGPEPISTFPVPFFDNTDPAGWGSGPFKTGPALVRV